MTGGTLFISKAYNLFSHYKECFEKAGYTDVRIAGEEKDSLYMLIKEFKPCFVFIDADFMKCETPLLMGQLLKRLPKLNITAVALCEYSVKTAMSFILYGVKSYVDYWDGIEEFRLGLAQILKGKKYISPKVNEYMENNHDYDLKHKLHITDREMSVLRLSCCGFSGNEIGERLGISRRTVEEHKRNLRKIWGLDNERELICMAFSLGLVTKEDIHIHTRKE